MTYAFGQRVALLLPAVRAGRKGTARTLVVQLTGRK
jgi:hypothetical protein